MAFLFKQAKISVKSVCVISEKGTAVKNQTLSMLVYHQIIFPIRKNLSFIFILIFV